MAKYELSINKISDLCIYLYISIGCRYINLLPRQGSIGGAIFSTITIIIIIIIIFSSWFLEKLHFFSCGRNVNKPIFFVAVLQQ